MTPVRSLWPFTSLTLSLLVACERSEPTERTQVASPLDGVSSSAARNATPQSVPEQPTKQQGAPVNTAVPGNASTPGHTPQAGSTHGSDEPADSSSPPFEGTAGIIDVPKQITATTLVDVRTARHAGFDRVVWEFAEQEAPGYHVEYIDKPVRKCGSGDTTAIAGDGWLEVRLYPANAHEETGKPTIAARERQLELGVARELELTCDFEAVVTWVVGVSSPNRYRVMELREPARLVLDVRH